MPGSSGEILWKTKAKRRGQSEPNRGSVFTDDVKIAVHRDMYVRKSNVMSENSGMEVCDEPLPKRRLVDSQRR